MAEDNEIPIGQYLIPIEQFVHLETDLSQIVNNIFPLLDGRIVFNCDDCNMKFPELRFGEGEVDLNEEAGFRYTFGKRVLRITKVDEQWRVCNIPLGDGPFIIKKISIDTPTMFHCFCDRPIPPQF